MVTARDFVQPQEYEKIRLAVAGQKYFKHEKTIKSDGTAWTFRLESSTVSERLASDIWQGNRYLVGINLDYKGKEGQGGVGFATVDYKQFSTWDLMKPNLDKWLKNVAGYEADTPKKVAEYRIEDWGQMSLF